MVDVVAGLKEAHDAVDVSAIAEYWNIQLLAEEGFRVGLNIFPAHAETPLHIHEAHDQIVIVQRGAIEVEAGGECTQLAVGDLVRVAAGTEHAFRSNVGAVALSLLVRTRAGELPITTLSAKILEAVERGELWSPSDTDQVSETERRTLSWIADNIAEGVARDLDSEK